MTDLADITGQLAREASQLRWQEWISTVTQLASVWYARKNNVLVFPTGMIGVLLAFWLYLFVASPPLYADAILNVYYFFMSVLGWYKWSQRNMEQEYMYPIRHCSRREWSQGLVLLSFSWLAISALLYLATDSNTPYADALVTSTAITAMWWMALRRIENWHMWIVSNLVAIPLNFYKGFYLFTLMYVLFLYMAWRGAVEWARTARQNISVR